MSLSLGLSTLVGLLPPLTLLVHCSFMHPHGLRTRRCTWARGDNTHMLFIHFTFCCDVHHRTTPNFSKGLGAVSDEGFTERARTNPFPKRMNHHCLILGGDLHHLRLETIHELLQRLPLILPYDKEVVRIGWGSAVRDILLPLQLRQLCKRSHVAVWEIDESVHRRPYQRAHEQLAPHDVRTTN